MRPSTTPRSAARRPRRPSGAATAGLALAGAVTVAGMALLVSSGMTGGFDGSIINVLRRPALVDDLAWLRPLTELGATWFVALIAVAIALGLALRGRPWLGLLVGATIGLSGLANSTIKLIVHRPRPDVIPAIVTETGYSFPSGHAFSSAVAYGTLALLVARSTWPVPVRIAAIAALGLLVALIGASRVYLGVHFPSDVVAGWIAGGVVVLCLAWLAERVSPVSSARGGGAAGADRAGPRSAPPGPP